MGKTFDFLPYSSSTITADLKSELLWQGSFLYVVGEGIRKEIGKPWTDFRIHSLVTHCVNNITGKRLFSSVFGRAKIDKTFKSRHHARLPLRSIIHTIALIILCTLCTESLLKAQNSVSRELRLPVQDSLESSLESFYEAERDAQLMAFDAGKSGDWKDLMPSVGITYTVSNDPRPAINWNPISIFNRKDAKKKQQLTRQSIVLQYEAIINEKLHRLRQIIQEYEIDLSALPAKEKALMIDEKLYDIKVEQYNQDMIKPSEYLQEEKKIIMARTAVDEYRKELMKRRAAVVYEAKW